MNWRYPIKYIPNRKLLENIPVFTVSSILQKAIRKELQGDNETLLHFKILNYVE